jgi:phosphocarrier protein HPr
MARQTVRITNRLGIHARPAAMVVKAASRFAADIFLSKGEVRGANGKSIMSVMMLAAEQGSEVTVSAEGKDAAEAVKAVAEILGSDFEGRI